MQDPSPQQDPVFHVQDLGHVCYHCYSDVHTRISLCHDFNTGEPGTISVSSSSLVLNDAGTNFRRFFPDEEIASNRDLGVHQPSANGASVIILTVRPEGNAVIVQ
jgi:hypothetical protein